MTTKIWVAVMSALTLVFVFLLAGRGLVLLQDPSPLSKAFGIAILVFPAFAIWSIVVEIRFGLNAQKLAERLSAEAFPELQVELRPSGKATKDSAAEEFGRISTELQGQESWQLWFRLGEAYDANGDRKRARAAIRKAIALANDSKAA